MACALSQHGASRPLIDLHIDINAGDFQGRQVAALIVEVRCDLREAGGWEDAGCAAAGEAGIIRRCV